MKYLLFILIAFNGSMYAQENSCLVPHVQQSLRQAVNNRSRLPPKVISIDGASHSTVRHLLNRLCSLPDTSYLEIGVDTGANHVAAHYKNSIKASYAFNEWSAPNDEFPVFLKNVKTHLPNYLGLFFSVDCFLAHRNVIFDTPVNILLCNTKFSYERQKEFFSHFDPIFAKQFIALIANWNVPEVKTATQQAFDELGYTVIYENILFDNHEPEQWLDGIYVAVINRTTK